MKLRSPHDADIARLALPALGTLVAEPLYVLADTAIVGRIGTEELAGLALASTVLLTAHGLSIFLAYSTTATVARALGGNKAQLAGHYVVQSLWLALAVGCGLAITMAVTSQPLLRLLGADGAVLELATRYLLISLIGFPFLLLAMAGGGAFHGRQNTRTPLTIAVIAATANLVIELFLVFGLGYGIGASALSTVVAQIGAAFAAAGLNLRWARSLTPSLRPDWPVISRLLSKGWALVVRTAALRGALTLSTALAARLGVAAVAAHQIGLQVWFTLALALDAVAIAGQALTGTYLGQGSANKARSAARRMIELNLGVGLVAAAAIFLGREPLASFFTGDPAVVDNALLVLAFVAVSQPINGYVFALDGVLIGAGDNVYLGKTMVYSALLFGFGAWLVWLTDSGLSGLWVALIGFMGSRAFWLWRRFRQDAWLAI